MRIKIQQFLFGRNHSWACVGQNLGRAFIKMGHQVDFVSTDGFKPEYCPDDILPYVRKEPSGKYDLQLSYTAPHNWPVYLDQQYGGTRLSIWNYEYNSKGNAPSALLQGFAKHHRAVDMVLPSSHFTKQVFESMKIPTERMIVVPHGINLDDFSTGAKTELKTKASRKILLNIAQPHRRKNLANALKAYGKAFTRDDDICLVAKVFTKNKGIQGNHQFDVDFPAMYKTFENKFKRHAEVEFVSSYIPNIAEIYNACDINYSTTYAECWHLPSLEALAAGLVNVVPRYGGQLDFCSDSNSLLIDGSVVRAPRDHQYWKFNPYAVHFSVDVDDAVAKLRKAVEDYDELKSEFGPHMQSTAAKFTWGNAAKQILDLCEDT